MRVGVAGASGYAGGELLRWCATHPAFDVAVATAERHEGERVAARAPSLAAAYPSLAYGPTSVEALSGCELVFLALPHGRSGALVAALLAEGTVVVDLGADLRLADEAAWTGLVRSAHPAPALLGTAAYGLVERHRDAPQGAALSPPRVLPDGRRLALGPLVDAGLADRHRGRGRASRAPRGRARASEALHFPALADDVTAYALGAHRHTAEMERELSRDVLFTPHLVPIDRGLLATCYRARGRRRRHRRGAVGPPRRLRPRALRRRHRRPAAPQVTSGGPTSPMSLHAWTPAPRRCSRAWAPSTTWARARPARPCKRERRARPRRDLGLSLAGVWP